MRGLVLLLVVLADVAYAKPRATRAAALKLDLPSLVANFPAIPMPLLSTGLAQPRPFILNFGGASRSWPTISHYGFHGCGGMRMTPDTELEGGTRPSSLGNSTLALSNAFLGCRTIKVARLEPLVPLAQYPEGFFGDWVHEGVLVAERGEIVDEKQMKELFMLLADTVGAPEDEFDYFWTAEDPALPLKGYRKETRFVPDLVVEFVGPVALLVEISVAQRRVLIQAGDDWNTFALDRRSAAALQEFVRARAKPF